jgi:ubiquinone/menaquinone biosynthesis C-methylase UbiE
LLYNRLSQTAIFQRHYDLVAADVAAHSDAKRILDIGTGPGWLLLALQRQLKSPDLVGIDISPAMVRCGRKNIARYPAADNIEIKEGDAAHMPFEDETFDTVVSTGSMHHWPDPVSGLREIYRVLKPGGTGLIYDLVRHLPPEITLATRKEYGRLRVTLLWLHSFEEPFYDTTQLEALAIESAFGEGEVRFVGALCCLTLSKPLTDVEICP